MKDRMTYLSEGLRIAGLKEKTRKPPLYYNVVDELDNILYSNNSWPLCEHFQKIHNLKSKTHIKSVRG